MHITIDCRMWGKNYGGIGRYTQEIVSCLLQHEQWEFTLLCSPEALSDLTDRTKGRHLVHLIPCSAKIFTLKEQWVLWRKVPVCDVFWSPYMNVPFLKTRARKQIVTLHDVFHLANPQYYSCIKRMIIVPYYYFSVRNSSRILTVSHFSKAEIERFFGKHATGKVICVYNGCDIDATNIHPKEIGHRYILFVGSIKPHKNLKNALEGFRQMQDKDVRFVIVGKKEGFITGDQEVFQLVEQINTEQERACFTGSVTDQELYAWYKGASMLVMPSLYEGFGLPIIEAMHFKLPIACSDMSVFKEIGKDMVIYFNPNSPQDICSKMIECLNLPHQEYPIWQSWQDSAKEICKILNSL